MPISVLIAPDFFVTPMREARWLADLPRLRREALVRWPDRRARHRSLLGSRLLREGLRRHGHPGASLASLRYALGVRPTIDLPLNFSISHCNGRILCAVSSDGPVGVDVETLGPLTAEDFRIYLTSAERAWADDDSARFYSIWTRKEAVVKAAGARGLPDLGRVDTRASATNATFAGQVWQTSEIPVGSGYVAHMAYMPQAGAHERVSFERISAQSLESDVPVGDADVPSLSAARQPATLFMSPLNIKNW